MKVISTTVVLLLIAAQSLANNFRIADQIYLPTAIYISTPWANYTSSVLVTNESNDKVSISCIYIPTNGPPVRLDKRDIIKLNPHTSKEIADFISFLGGSGFGQVIFNACKDGEDCTRKDHSNYRNISVTSRIYITNAAGGTIGQDMPGFVWWSYGTATAPVKVVGIKSGGNFHTNIGLINASEFSSTDLTVTLYDGATNEVRDQTTIHLLPLEQRQRGATELFPKLGEWNRLNRTRIAQNAYITVTSSGFTPQDDPDHATDAFFAYGSLVDSTTSSATTLEPVFAKPIPDNDLAQALQILFKGDN